MFLCNTIFDFPKFFDDIIRHCNQFSISPFSISVLTVVNLPIFLSTSPCLSVPSFSALSIPLRIFYTTYRWYLKSSNVQSSGNLLSNDFTSSFAVFIIITLYLMVHRFLNCVFGTVEAQRTCPPIFVAEIPPHSGINCLSPFSHLSSSALSRQDLFCNLLQRKSSLHFPQYGNKLQMGISLKEGDNICQNECCELQQIA